MALKIKETLDKLFPPPDTRIVHIFANDKQVATINPEGELQINGSCPNPRITATLQEVQQSLKRHQYFKSPEIHRSRLQDIRHPSSLLGPKTAARIRWQPHDPLVNKEKAASAITRLLQDRVNQQGIDISTSITSKEVPQICQPRPEPAQQRTTGNKVEPEGPIDRFRRLTTSSSPTQTPPAQNVCQIRKSVLFPTFPSWQN